METKKIGLSCEITKLKASLFFAILLVVFMPFWLGSERQTVTSYYPAPHGSYTRLYARKTKAGDVNRFLEAGRGDRNIGGNAMNDVDYFYSNTQLYVRSPGGTINLSPASETVTFLPDNANYAPYVSSFCSWKNGNCSGGYFPIARGNAVGNIQYGAGARNFRLCCRITID